MDRRSVVIGGAVGAAAVLSWGARARALPGRDIFTLGVASGEPVSDGMVLWTRLAPEPLLGDGGMPDRSVPVRWEVAADERFTQLAASGTAQATPAAGHTVHVEVGGLASDRPYWYRFLANGEASAIGRTRTAPARDALVDRLRFCFGSCQKYEAGHYAAWSHVVAMEPDLILFLGDYIYEGDPAPGGVRRHLNPEPTDVAGYRARYATYRLDPLLQAAHAVAPWAVTWDDHEVANDYANDRDQHNGDPAAFLKRRAAAYQVYWEHMPLRRLAHPHGPAMRLYRTLGWGRLAAFQMLDDRQFRSPRPCQPPELALKHLDYVNERADCPERRDPRRSLLGAAQERWVRDAFASSPAQWNMLAQQTIMADYPKIDPATPDARPTVYNYDTWGGYPATRERILRHWRDARTRNPIVLSGDIHTFVAADLLDPDRPDRGAVASEFVGGSITSLQNDRLLAKNAAANPAFRFVDGDVRGYAACTLTRDRCDVVFRGLADAYDPASTVRDLATFTIENGRAGLRMG